jgi:hypothetical protein
MKIIQPRCERVDQSIGGHAKNPTKGLINQLTAKFKPHIE